MSNQSRDDAVRAQVLGRRVEKLLACSADANIFTTYGQLLITLLYGQVTVAESSGATTLKLQTETNTLDLCATTTTTGDAVGEVYYVTGEKAVILNGTASTPIVDVGAQLTGFPSWYFFVGRTATADAIQLDMVSTSATQVVLWSVFYVPLEVGAYIEAA